MVAAGRCWAAVAHVWLMGLALGAVTLPDAGGGSNDEASMVASPRVVLGDFSGDTWLVRTMAGIHDRFGSWLAEAAAELGCAVSDLAAVLKVESGGAGFDSSGRMLIRFENHVFDREYGGSDFDTFFRYSSTKSWQGHEWRSDAGQSFASVHSSQDSEWQVLAFAQSLADAASGTDTAALRSASYGAPQIVGFNAESVGFASVQDMFVSFSSSLRAQMDALVAFIRGRTACLGGLRDGVLLRLAGGYNGPGTAEQYGASLSDAALAYGTVLARLGLQEPATCEYKGLYGLCDGVCGGGQVYDASGSGGCVACCIKDVACGAAPSGLCVDETVVAHSGACESNLCPGGADIRCCSVASTPLPTGAPSLLQPVCSYKGLSGTCSADCAQGSTIYDASPGCSNCCVPTEQCEGDGLCVDDTIPALCQSQVFQTGLCSGNSDIRCCQPKSCTYKGLDGTCDQLCASGVNYASGDCDNCCVQQLPCTQGLCVDDTIPSLCDSQTYAVGLCPGSADITCCQVDSNVPEPSSAPSRAPSPAPAPSPLSPVVIAVGSGAALVACTAALAALIVWRRRAASRARAQLQVDVS